MVVFNIDVVVAEKGGGGKAMEAQLERLNRTAEKTRKVTERIGRRVRVGGIKKARQETDRLKKSAQGVGAVFASLGLSLGLREIAGKFIELSDTFTNYQNRLKIVTTDTENLAMVTDSLFAIADRTRSAYGSTAELFARVSLASKELGRSQQELLMFTEALNKSVILSGASAQEARAGIIQLSQGMASGALRGDELRSVLEQLPKVADVLAKSLGVTRGDLRRMGEAGELTGKKIVDAMLKAKNSIDRDFAKTVPTIGQAFTQLESKLVRLTGTFNEVTKASTGFAILIQFFADNLVAVAAGMLVLGGAFAVVAVKAIAATAAGAAFGATLASAAPAAAIAAVGIGILANAIQQYNEDAAEIQRVTEEAQSSLSTLTAFGTLPKQIASTSKELETLRRIFEEGGRTNQFAAEQIKRLEFRLAVLNDKLKNGGEEFKNNSKQFQTFKKALEAANLTVEKGAKLAALSSRERKIQLQVEKEFLKIRKKNADLTEADTKQVRARLEAGLRENQALADKAAVLEGIRGPQEAMIRNTRILKELQDEGKISVDEYKKALAELNEKGIELPKLADLGGASGANVLVEALKRIKEQGTATGESLEVTGDKLREALLKGSSGAKTLRERVALIQAKAKEAGVSVKDMKIVIDEVMGRSAPQVLADSIDDLRFRQEKQLITARQMREEIRQLGPVGQKSATTLSDGFARAFDKMRDEANDLAAVGEKLVDTFANKATDAIVEFAETGKFSFKEFARSLLADIAKIIIRLLIVKALSAIAGAAGGGAAATVVSTAANVATASTDETNQGRQDGGTVQPGRSFVVGENGPEIFKPGQTGTIIPNAKDQQQAAPEVKVNITNITDPNEIAGVIDSGDADQNIVNAIARNKDVIKAGLQ